MAGGQWLDKGGETKSEEKLREEIGLRGKSTQNNR